MQRYHTNPPGSGNGIEFGVMRPGEVVDGHANGFWVLYTDAKAAIADALARGRTEGQTKLDAYLESERAPSKQCDLEMAYNMGVATAGWTPPGELRGSARDVFVPVTDTRTNQLLNELYHDRARLEKLVQTLLGITDAFSDGLTQDHDIDVIETDAFETYSDLIAEARLLRSEHGA